MFSFPSGFDETEGKASTKHRQSIEKASILVRAVLRNAYIIKANVKKKKAYGRWRVELKLSGEIEGLYEEPLQRVQLPSYP
jgi:hypothetical protein